MNLRTIAEWLRNRRASVQADTLRAEREERQLAYLRNATRLREDARALFAEAQAVECFAERYRLYCLALAAECRAEASHALAGGDHETAALNTIEAEGYDRRAGLPAPVQSAEPAPGMAAHA